MCFEIIFYFRVPFWDTYEKQDLRLEVHPGRNHLDQESVPWTQNRRSFRMWDKAFLKSTVGCGRGHRAAERLGCLLQDVQPEPPRQKFACR